MAKKQNSSDKVVPLRSRDWLAAGDLLADKYRLLTELGEGGMGAVWLANYEALDMEVAIKVIRSEVKEAAGKGANERLIREARAAARLGHPAIVRITDFGDTPQGDPFLVMELLEGEDLASALERRGRIDAVRTVRIMLPIAHAMAAAHDKGIVHRDIKPENIFFAQLEDGSVQPKLIDFGVAKSELQARERITMAGALLGSPGYMSPEAARGDEADARSDIWSFCVVLYEMMSGRLPFQGKNYHALLRSIIEDEVQPVTDFNTADEVLWSILEKGLFKGPEERWESMRQVGAALARWLIVQDVTEDICGASVVTTWLRGKKPMKAMDIFESIAPPRRGPSSQPAPEISVRATDMDSEIHAEEHSPEPSPVSTKAAPVAAEDDAVDVQAGMETDRPRATPSEPRYREDTEPGTDDAAAEQDEPDEPDGAASSGEEGPKPAAGSGDAAAKGKPKRSVAGRLFIWVVLLALLAAGAWAWQEHHAKLGLPPPPWMTPAAEPDAADPATPPEQIEPQSAPTLLPDVDPTPVLSADVPPVELPSLGDSADPAASAAAKPPPRRWRKPARPVDIYE
ncbi:MAG: protein kinase [Deltaproteobacteria bacterium]|nr:protein kinase [Deltaproteobacteria bacterium]